MEVGCFKDSLNRVFDPSETDSEGNIYTTETWEGKRLQKFVYQGMGTVEKGSDLAELWPTQD